MTERSIIEAASDLRRRREPYLVATVVDAQGSVYRRPGARMLLTQFRWIAGSVSGGCLEADLARRGWWHTRHGESVVLTYNSQFPADDEDVRATFGLGSDGVVEVLLERAGQPGRIDPLVLAERCMRTGVRGVIATVIRGAGARIGSRIAWCAGDQPDGDVPVGALRDHIIATARVALDAGRSAATSCDGSDVFIEVVLPPPRLFVLGTGHDALPVARLARTLGWNVTICGRTPRVATRDRFASFDVVFGAPSELAERIDEPEHSAAVVMAHHYDTDRDHLGMLVDTRVRYIGVLGPRARMARMFDDLGRGPHDDRRVHVPGLELGAETPDEVALAIVAEIQAILRHAPAPSLREHREPTHERQLATAI
jgi:xanthine dehydrogenase accessory factor